MLRLPPLRFFAVCALLLASFRPAAVVAQGAPLTVEVRGGASVPQSDFANGNGIGEGTRAGPVFGVELTLASPGRRTLYAGFSQARFGCEDAGCPQGGSYVATGVNAGIRISLLPDRTVIPWIGVGGVTNRVESPGTGGTRASDAGVSSLGYGGEVSAGLYVSTGGLLHFNPAVRVLQSRTTLPGGAELTLRYAVVDIGFVLAF